MFQRVAKGKVEALLASSIRHLQILRHYWGIIGTLMEKRMETTMWYLGVFIGIMEKKMETT